MDIPKKEEVVVFRCPDAVYGMLERNSRDHKLEKSIIIRLAINKYLRYTREGRTIRLKKRRIKGAEKRVSFREHPEKIAMLRDDGKNLSGTIWRILVWYFRVQRQ